VKPADQKVNLSFLPNEIDVHKKTSSLYFRKQGKLVVYKAVLKVMGNEKSGGSGGWLLFEDGFGLWRSMSVCFLISLSFL
jgi:hypothetical protein